MNTGSSGGSQCRSNRRYRYFAGLMNPESLSRDALSAAFYQLARRYYPDVNPGAAELMANIKSARRTILDS
jgi:DnaJ-class molecular chaperone